MPEYALEMREITKDFPGVRALNRVTLQAKPGEIHCLLGENGAGKSTLMKILDGFYPAGTYAGQLIIAGNNVELHSPQDARRKAIGFVPQEINVVEQLTVAENIFLGTFRPEHGWLFRPRELQARARLFLQQQKIDLDPARQVSLLPASQRQLVMIARALAAAPSVLILDEPTSSLTTHETRNLFEIVRRLKDRGGTILFISHKLDEIMEIGDAVTVLRDGAVVARFARGTFTHDDIIAAMVGRKLENLFPPRTPQIGAEEILTVRNLTVRHPQIRGKKTVDDVSFSVRRGEILGIAGLIGSGRSEVLNAIYGRARCRGEILVEGRPLPRLTPRIALRHGIGLVTEERKREGLLFNFGIRENITLHRLQSVSRFSVLNKQTETRHVASAMKQLAIRGPSPGTPVLNLSGGNQQKVLLAKTLFAQPKILLLDEPTKGVDVAAKYEIYKQIFDLAAQGMALIVVSSEFAELLGLCDRFIVLARGKVADSFDRAAASEHRLMRAATGVSEIRR